MKLMENWYTIEVAESPSTSPDILRKILEKGKDDGVSCYAAYNPNCPPDALKMVLEKGKDDYVSYYAARNPNCPPYALKMILERGNDNRVSRYTAENPNCPLLAKIQWMRMTGKIGIEDPTKHKIEKEEEKPDKDLQILRDMVKENFSIGSIKKIAQENWYTEEVAENPNTSPDILRKILEKGKADNVSYWAVINPYCPPDALAMVLERGNHDPVSFRASRNPNCPPLARIKWKNIAGEELTEEEKIAEQAMETEVTEPTEPNKPEELKATPEEIRDFELNYMAKNNSWYKIATEQDALGWVRVDSSFIDSIRYSQIAEILDVKIKRNDKIGNYTFMGVPEEVYIAFLNSKSKGTFFNQIVRKRYTEKNMKKN